MIHLRGKWLVRGLLVTAGLLMLGGLAQPALADRMSSSDFTIDTGELNGFGGAYNSTNYQMVAAGGQTVVGNGASGSYILQEGDIPPLSQSIQVALQPRGLVGYWPMDEGSGTLVADNSVNGNNGTADPDPYTSNQPAWITGQIGSAIETDTTNDSNGKVRIPYNDSLYTPNAMTVSLWAKQYRDEGGNKGLISFWNYSGNQIGSWALQTGGSSSTLRLFTYNDLGSGGDYGDNYVDTAVGTWPPGDNTWHNVVVTFDGSAAAGSRVKFYVDGVAASTTAYGTIPTVLQKSTRSQLVIGTFPGLNRSWDGAIDQVKLFSRALTPDEITADYLAAKDGVPSGVTMGQITPGASKSVDFDSIVQTGAPAYGLSISQNHPLQTSGGVSVPAVAGTVAAPVVWNEATTKGLGFSLLSAPNLDSKWGAGSDYAAFPSSATTFYSRSDGTSGIKDVVTLRTRADVTTDQVAGSYSNQVTVTGTTLP